MSAGAAPMRAAPPRRPGGWWLAHPGYRSYVLFAATGFVLAIDAWILLRGVQALAGGAAPWEAYLAALRWWPNRVGVLVLLVGTVFFSVRWLRVGVKVATVPLGALPAPPTPLVGIGHFAGLLMLTTLLLLVLSGVIL